MNRVATIPLQRTMSDAIQRTQVKIAATQLQQATGIKAQTYAALGTESVRNLSARTLVTTQDAHAKVANRLGTTLAIYDANITSIDTIGADLRIDMMTAIGTGKAAGLQQAIEAAFDQFRSALNASEGGLPLFGGAQTAQPFTPAKLADTVGLDPAQAFTNDDVRASARVGENLDVAFGITASELGTDMLAAFRTLAEAGNFGETPTGAQLATLRTALGQMDTALSGVRAVNAGNGRRQAQVETLGLRAEERSLILRDIISRNEDADFGQVAIDLAQQKAILQASYSVFSQLSELSLVNFLR